MDDYMKSLQDGVAHAERVVAGLRQDVARLTAEKFALKEEHARSLANLRAAVRGHEALVGNAPSPHTIIFDALPDRQEVANLKEENGRLKKQVDQLKAANSTLTGQLREAVGEAHSQKVIVDIVRPAHDKLKKRIDVAAELVQSLGVTLDLSRPLPDE